MESRILIRFAGMIFLGCSAVLYGTFQYLVIHPAFRAQPDGTYGELYGPLAFVRIPIYVVIAMVMLIGILLWIAGG